MNEIDFENFERMNTAEKRAWLMTRLAGLDEEHEEDRKEFIRETAAEINEYGYDPEQCVNDLAGILGVTPKRAKAKTNAGRKLTRRRFYVAPDDESLTYKGGKIPGWMKERMVAAGYDPDDLESARTFRENELEIREAA